MNSICLHVDEYRDNNVLTKDGIEFMNVQVIKLLIDGIDIEKDVNFTDAMICWQDLSQSCYITGNYLIFTCACGVAMDGGWEGVDITVSDDCINWKLEIGNIIYDYKFNKKEYVTEIKSIENYLKLNTTLTLEPSTVVYPEDWVNL